MAGGGGSPSNVTQTSITQLPSWLNNANTFGASQAQTLYNNGQMAPNPYPGNTVAPFSPMQEQYLSGVENLATQGSPVTSAAQNYLTGELNGNELNPASNPYLDATFQQAAGAVQNQLGSEFAGAGRNPQASLGAQADQMNNLATQIYGQNYQDAANRQLSAVAQANPIANENWYNLAQLGQAGAQVQGQAQNMIGANQNLYNAYAQQPANALANYMNQVNSLAHGGNASSTQPYFNNSGGAAGAFGGAAAGAGLASALVAGGAVNSWNPVGWGMMGAGALLGSGIL